VTSEFYHPPRRFATPAVEIGEKIFFPVHPVRDASSVYFAFLFLIKRDKKVDTLATFMIIEKVDN
jgi:hypothetical protein